MRFNASSKLIGWSETGLSSFCLGIVVPWPNVRSIKPTYGERNSRNKERYYGLGSLDFHFHRDGNQNE